MITLLNSNFWYYDKSVDLNKNWLLCTLYNLSSSDVEALRIILQILYHSTIHILKNKLLTKLFINLDIYNKTIILSSFNKNLFFFRNTIYNLFNTINMSLEFYLKIIGYYNSFKLIDFMLLCRYNTDTVFKLYKYIISLSSTYFNVILAITNNSIKLVFDLTKIYIYIVFNISSIIAYKTFWKTNLF